MRNKKHSLKNFLKEHGEFEEKLDEESVNQIKEDILNFNNFNESIYTKRNLEEVVGKIKNIVENFREVLSNENDEWFDEVTLRRRVKNIQESYKVFESTAKDVTNLQKRLESAYEDIGLQLEKYYEIKSLDDVDEGNTFGAAVTKAKKAGKKKFKVGNKEYKVK